MPDTIWLKTFLLNQNKIIVFAGYESDAGKYYAATAEREKNKQRKWTKEKVHCLASFPNKWDAKINSQPESLASKVDEQLTGYEWYWNDPRTVRMLPRVPADKQWVSLWEISQWLFTASLKARDKEAEM